MSEAPKKKRPNNKSKGSTFERDICRLLSLWWTDQQREDVFWRTAASGALATIRGKTKQGAYGMHGDIQAVDPIGAPLMKVFTFELKKGYPKATISDTLDTIQKHKRLPEFVQFILQARKSQEQAGSYSWAVIHRRDNHHTMLVLPNIPAPWTSAIKRTNYQTMTLRFKLPGKELEKIDVIQCRLGQFLATCSPNVIRAFTV